MKTAHKGKLITVFLNDNEIQGDKIIADVELLLKSICPVIEIALAKSIKTESNVAFDLSIYMAYFAKQHLGLEIPEPPGGWPKF